MICLIVFSLKALPKYILKFLQGSKIPTDSFYKNSIISSKGLSAEFIYDSNKNASNSYVSVSLSDSSLSINSSNYSFLAFGQLMMKQLK